jgi:hypothetical protein
VVLLASTLLDLSQEIFVKEVRARFGSELRRLGVFTQLCLLGAQACLEASGTSGRLGVLLATEYGGLTAARAALDDGLRRGEPMMPFTFIATQTNLAGALLARRHDVARAACLYLGAQDWPWVLRIARSWLGQCERVAVGWVEDAARGEPHRSHWGVLVRDGAGIPVPAGEEGLPETMGEWLGRFTSHRRA